VWVRGNKDIDIEKRLKIIVSSVLIVKAKLVLLTTIQRKKEHNYSLEMNIMNHISITSLTQRRVK